MEISVYNDTGGVIAAAQVVYQSGIRYPSQLPTVALASAAAAATAAPIGITVDAIADATIGYIVITGDYYPIDTSVFAVNADVYLSNTPGAIATTAGIVESLVGVVITASSTGTLKFSCLTIAGATATSAWVNTKSIAMRPQLTQTESQTPNSFTSTNAAGMGDKKYSLSFWVYPLPSQMDFEENTFFLIGTESVSYTYGRLLLYADAPLTVSVYEMNGSGSSSSALLTTALSPWAWNHLVVTSTSTSALQGSVTFYVNGVSSGSATGEQFTGTAADQLVMVNRNALVDSNNLAWGSISRFSDIALWSDIVIDATMVGLIYNSGIATDLENTIGVTVPTNYWRTGDGIGDSESVIKDVIGSVNLDVPRGLPRIRTYAPSSTTGYSTEFDDIDDYTKSTSVIDVSVLSGAMSISGWLQPFSPNSTYDGVVLYIGDHVSGGYARSKFWLTLYDDYLSAAEGNGTAYYRFAEAQSGGGEEVHPSAGDWVHIAVTSTSTSSAVGLIKGYVNGIPVCGDMGMQWSDTVPTYSHYAVCGQLSSAANGQGSGRRAELSIWSKTLSDSEVLALSTAGISDVRKPVDLSTLSFYSASCVHWWKLGADLTDHGSASAGTGGGTNDMIAYNGPTSVQSYPY